jgi:glycosyltransferase involved in cell wall biosynthesis
MISAIIPTRCSKTRHGLGRLYLTIQSFNHQTLPRDQFEVVVVDDGSDWDLQSEFKKWGLEFDYQVVRTEGIGMCHAYNLGVKSCKGERIYLGLDDTVLTPDFLQLHVNLAEHDQQVLIGQEKYLHHLVVFKDPITGELEPRVDAADLFGEAANTLELENWTLEPGDVVHQRVLEMLSTVPQKVRDAQNTFKDASLKKMHWLAMRVGNHSMSKDLYERIGGLDETLDQGAAWYADLELGIRLVLAGAEMRYIGDAITYNLMHHKQIDLKQAEVNYGYLMKKYPYLEVALIPMFFAYGSDYTVKQFAQGVRNIAQITGALSIQDLSLEDLVHDADKVAES